MKNMVSANKINNKCFFLNTTRHFDDRGFFAETYSRRKYIELGIDVEFVQDNHSLSRSWNPSWVAFPGATACAG